MTTITAQQNMRLEILRHVMNDTAAAQAAIDFIQDDELKFELFKDQWKHAGSECSSVSRAQKAVQMCKEAELLFPK
ncbi:DUF2560 family protein [Providencia sp. CRE-3FA-0001]|uniref:DUF2560 family protein n=1 Tax=Providencia huashanensis TaxID=3037798 RepID=A0AA42FH19_9GAMM|nr:MULTISPECIES: DUF2560 family protein [Morganellaceae]ELR5174853.1 DUF2560 family protein [Providencia rettgeri]ELR5197697.1 DUF2560 family protein [Providencia rettgeri]MDG4696401.1 DUF2560 family protein [Providencia sp. CRE-3FA-0001]NBM04402.1 DUF2560 family protein [Proteus sp. G2671]